MAQLTVRPADGGQLVTRAAAVDVGPANYTRKRNIRRDLSDEVFREGFDYFNPIPDAADYQTFPFPGPVGEPLTLNHLVRRPNGESAIVVGTKQTLWRFNTQLLGYFVSGYIAPGYFRTPTRWQIIGDGFSTNGRRWEAKDIDGTTVFNNGDDLPVAFRSEWGEVLPLRELREQGVVCLGTIGETNGVLLGGDVTEVREQDQPAVLNVIRSGSVKVSQAGYKSSGTTWATSDGTNVIANRPIFAAGDVGRTLVWWNGQRQVITGYTNASRVTVAAGPAVAAALSFRVTDELGAATGNAMTLEADGAFFTAEMAGRKVAWADGSVRRIVTVIGPQQATTDIDVPVAAGAVAVENPITYLSKSALVAHYAAKSPAESISFDQRQYRVLWGEVGKPTAFGITVPVKIEAASPVMTTDRMNRSLEEFESVAVVGAALNSGVLLPVTITAAGPGVIKIGQVALSGGTGSVQRVSSVGSIVGHHDLQDDGAAVLKMLVLQNRLVVYTDSNLFLGAYTGQPENPFLFERVKVAHGRALHYRHTLLCLSNAYHVYAGKTQFYRFDLAGRQPEPMQAADLVGNLFFDYASLANAESIYAADNELTQEAWVVCPSNTADPVLAYDYVYNTFSTADQPVTCAATIKAANTLLAGATGDWFLMGTSSGTLLIYGRTTEPNPAWDNAKEIYYRRSARPYSATKYSYSGVLTSGLINFAADNLSEKHLSTFVLEFSSLQLQNPTVNVAFKTSINQSKEPVLLGEVTLVGGDDHNMIPIHATAHLFQDQITISTGYPVRLHAKTYEFQIVRSKSHHRA